MTILLSRIFRTVGNNPNLNMVNKHLPMINSIVSASSEVFGANQLRKKKFLMSWYKIIPELTALVDKVAKDIVYKWHFEPINPNDSGRNKVMAANKFAMEIGLRERMLSQAIDILITGEAFGWIGKIKEETIKEEIEKQVSKEIFLERKEKKYITNRIYNELKKESNFNRESIELKQEDGFINTSFIDEDLLRPRKYRYVASTTVEIEHNQVDILKYIQVVGTNQVVFQPKEIIRFTFFEIDGKINGYSPVEAILVQLELLRQMWQNMLSIHKNGGAPDKIFILEDHKNQQNFNRLVEQLEKYKLAENKHGNMVFTGKLTVEDLNQLDKMQFMDMGLYITGLIAMQWQVPRSSIPYIVGGTNTKDDTGGNSEKGYWRNVEMSQMLFAEPMNTQLWIPHFGVKIVFDETYIQQDVQIQTAKQLKLGNIMTTDSILKTSGKQLTDKKKLKLLNLHTLDVEEAVDMIEATSTLNNQLPQADVNDSDDKKNISDKKRKEQNSVIASRGMPPTGVGKEMTKESKMEYKESQEMNVLDIDMRTFIKLYNEDKAFHPQAPRIFMSTSDTNTSFLYKSTDFTYRTIVPTEDVINNRIWLMNLEAGKIFRI